MRARGLLVVVSAAAAFQVAGPGAHAPVPRGTHMVEMRDFAFSPMRIDVSVGDTVVWINRDLLPHNVADSLGALTSPVMEKGGRWSWVAAEPGVIGYMCTFHPSMRASISVSRQPRPRANTPHRRATRAVDQPVSPR